jgi:DNA-binding NtrC family response regulator
VNLFIAGVVSALPPKADIRPYVVVLSWPKEKRRNTATATLYRLLNADSVYGKMNCLGTIKMPGLSFAKKSTSRSQKIEFSADQIEAVRQLVGRTVAEVVCELIIETLANQRGNRTNAAELLGISIRTLRNKIHEYDGRGKSMPKPGVHWPRNPMCSAPVTDIWLLTQFYGTAAVYKLNT